MRISDWSSDVCSSDLQPAGESPTPMTSKPRSEACFISCRNDSGSDPQRLQVPSFRPTASLAVLPAATAVLWHARQSRTPTGRKVSLGGCNHPQDTTWFMGVGAGRSPVTFDTVQAHRKVKGTVTRTG